MRRTVFLPFLFSCLASLAGMYIFYSPDVARKAKTPAGEFADPDRLQQEFLMLRDPRANRIPSNIYQLEQQFAERMPRSDKWLFHKGQSVYNAQALNWTERGPNNIGGRVRALGIDIRTTGTPTVIAGGVSGGMWKSTDGGAVWVKKTSSAQLHSVTCVAQDTREGSRDVWYAGTGEYLMNSASGWYADYMGDGVFKSTDNGESWSLLSSTQTSDNTYWTSQWQYVWRVAVHPVSGNVYAMNPGGLYSSANGGASWSLSLGHGNTSIKGDVAIASDGTVYSAQNRASSGQNDSYKGIRKSTNDGATWTDVSPVLPEWYGRICLAVAPSNSSAVYFLLEGASGANSTPNLNGHQVWRSTDAGGTWANITSILPDNAACTAANIGNFSTQDGYDMMICVKPDNPAYLIVGGTNLFRIPDVTNDNQTLAQKHIGGYGSSGNGTSDSKGNFYNHHSDTHWGCFKPGSSAEFWNATDAGVFVAADITATPNNTFWQAKQTGLNISQVFCVSIDKSAPGSAYLSSGFQDQGNWMSQLNGAKTNWSQNSASDGAFTEIAPNGVYAYQSTQRGLLYRFTKTDPSSPITSYINMYPSTLSNPMFINPYVMDPAQNNILYFAGGNTVGPRNTGVYRCTDADAASPTWTYLTNTDIASEQVSALAVSTANSTNVLYYGSSGGKVFRIDNANTADASVSPVNITGGSFPAGFVRCIAVDPLNSANVLVAFSNYNVDRLWYSTNSGNSWTSVTGNLTGANSPSVRWAKIFTVGSVLHTFLATSTGVYYTVNLNGASTVWTQEAVSEIGNVVCTMIDYRPSDNKLVVGTHGRGVFETTLNSPLPVELIAFGATVQGGKVSLVWNTASESNNYGFDIERAGEDMQWQKIAFQRGAGNSNTMRTYSYTDLLPLKGKNFYRLKQIDAGGAAVYSRVVSAVVDVPQAFALEQNFPNPFNPATTIRYSVPEQAAVTIRVFDSKGAMLKELVNGSREPGSYTAQFDGSGYASGIYYCEFKAGTVTLTRKMLLMK